MGGLSKSGKLNSGKNHFQEQIFFWNFRKFFGIFSGKILLGTNKLRNNLNWDFDFTENFYTGNICNRKIFFNIGIKI